MLIRAGAPGFLLYRSGHRVTERMLRLRRRKAMSVVQVEKQDLGTGLARWLTAKSRRGWGDDRAARSRNGATGDNRTAGAHPASQRRVLRDA
jgi:hypothetical protein